MGIYWNCNLGKRRKQVSMNMVLNMNLNFVMVKVERYHQEMDGPLSDT